MNDSGRESTSEAGSHAGFPEDAGGNATAAGEAVGADTGTGARSAADDSATRHDPEAVAAGAAGGLGAASDASDGDGAGDDTGATGGAAPGAAGGTRPRRRRRRRRRSFWREFPILVAVALLLAVLIKTYALQAFFIPSGSMENTLDINDRVLVNKLVYDFRGIHRGDIVVFNGDGSWSPGSVPVSSNVFSEFFTNLTGMFGLGHPGSIYVKRVIGLPGDHVACCDALGRVTVNGVALNESAYLYPANSPSLIRFDIVVPAGRLWVMGDHREVSDDSRGHLGQPGGGTIPRSAVVGRAFIIIWPPSRWRILPIPGTFEQPALNKAVAALPLALGFTGAVPLTLLQRRIRRRARRQRGRESS
jgi:signal peptidase I